MVARAKKKRKLDHQKRRLERGNKRAWERVTQRKQKLEGNRQRIKNSEAKKGFRER